MAGQTPVVIAGAGPAGLSAALTLAGNGRLSVIHERHGDVGHRFHNDFQGLENWTTSQDVLDEFAELGIAPSFENTPYCEVVIFDPRGREFICRSSQPLFYLVRRGAVEGSLDMALKQQAVKKGVKIHFNSPCSKLTSGGIVAQGPHRPDVIAVGYVFETSAADGAYIALSDDLAPQGYSYLLIHNGRATVASCMFNDFHNEQRYLKKTVEFFKLHVGLVMENSRKFGGTGNFSIPLSASKNGILHAGECAGFQDAFAGFGLRYAVLSGYFAALAHLRNTPDEYDLAWKKRFLGLMKVSLVNRYLYAMFGNSGYTLFTKHVVRNRDMRDWIRRQYNPGFLKSLFYPLATRTFTERLKGMCFDPDCYCTWCRYQHERQAEAII